MHAVLKIMIVSVGTIYSKLSCIKTNALHVHIILFVLLPQQLCVVPLNADALKQVHTCCVCTVC